MNFTLFISSARTIAILPNLLFCLVSFLVKMWFLKACFRFTLPVPVTLNRFFAPDFVFTLGIVLQLNQFLFSPIYLPYLWAARTSTSVYLQVVASVPLFRVLQDLGQILTIKSHLVLYTQWYGQEKTPWP